MWPMNSRRAPKVRMSSTLTVDDKFACQVQVHFVILILTGLESTDAELPRKFKRLP